MSVLEKLDKMDEKLDEILMELRLKKPVPTTPFTSKLTVKEEQSLRKLEQEWEDDEDDALKVSKEPELKIVWVIHNDVKYKSCKYKCGNYVSWDNNTKKYIHYDSEFKLIGADCPKYGGS